MVLDVVYLLAACVVCALATAPAKEPTHGALKNEFTNKREASVSSGSEYHGPSYKYLPPSTLSASFGGYDSYNSGLHDSHVGGVGAYNFGGSNNAGSHDIRQFGSTGGTKVKTFIVETQPVHVDEDVSHGLSGYRYDGPSSLFSGGYSGSQHEFSSGYNHGHGVVHKIKPNLGHLHGYSSPGSLSGSGFSHYGGSGASFRNYKNLGGATHSLSGSSPFHNYGGGSSIGSKYGNMHAGLGPVRNYGGLHTVGVGSPSGYGLKNHDHLDHGSSAHLHSSLDGVIRESGYTSGGQGGYSYEIPVHHDVQRIPLTSYGLPVNDLSPPYRADEPENINVQPLPSYAAGHKGLGHFGFTASSPQILHTDYIASDKYVNSLSNHDSPHGSGHIAVKAPFKPSLFLGASHESSAISGGFGGHAPSHGVATQYLPPPTSDGYDYLPPSALYGTRGHVHSGHEDSAGPPNDLESVYQPSTQSSYGSPTLPEENYLPPHH